jgi:hypothetical protein
MGRPKNWRAVMPQIAVDCMVAWANRMEGRGTTAERMATIPSRTQWRGCDGVGLKGTPLESMTPGAEMLSVMGRGCEPVRESFISRTGARIFREQHVTQTA